MRASSITVLLADSHRVLTDAISEHIRRVVDLRVVGTASSAAETLFQARETWPRVVLSEVHLGDFGSFDVAAKILEEQPDAKFVFLTSSLSDVLIEQAIRIHASYLLKSETLDRVVAAIRAVAKGEQVFSRMVADRLQLNGKTQRYELKSQRSSNSLTPRQLEILCRFARGRTVRQVAEELSLTEKGAESHKYRIMHKLEIYDQVGLARYAIREGLMNP